MFKRAKGKKATRPAPKIQSKGKASGKSVLVSFIMDQSGSMATQGVETVQGFNRYLQTLKESKEGKYLFSLTLFNTGTERRYVALPVEQIPELTSVTYRPDGGTALHDAIGDGVEAIEDNKADKILVVIMTDGHENSSMRWTKDKIKALIAKKEAQGNWTFVFMGASIDAYDVGVSIGVQPGNAYQYQPAQTGAVYAAMAMGTHNFQRSSAMNAQCFTPHTITARARGSVSGGIGGQSVSMTTANLLSEDEMQKIEEKFGLKQK